MMKNWKRLLSILLAVLLLVGMGPVQTAEAECNHTWGPKDYFGRTPTCVDPVSWLRKCTKCGDEMDGEDYGLHQWGAWGTVRQATCVQEGQQQRTCSLCQRSETRALSKTAHKYGDWYRRGIPTCTEEGLKAHECIVCGSGESLPIEPLGHDWGDWYVVRQPSETQKGLEERACSRCSITEQREFGGGSSGEPVATAEPAAVLSIVKTVTSAPRNGEFYTPGEEIHYSMTATVSGMDAYSVRIFDPMFNHGLALASADVLAPGQSLVASGSHVVTEEDARLGNVTNTAGVYWFNWAGGVEQKIASNTVTVACGIPASPLALEVYVKNSEASPFEPGDTIEFEARLTNTGAADLPSVSIDVALNAPSKVFGFGHFVDNYLLAAGASTTVGFQHRVTHEDALNGNVTFSVTARGVDALGIILPDISGAAAVDPVFVAELAVTHELLNTPANSMTFTAGEVLQLGFTVSNYTGEDLTNVQVTPILTGVTAPVSIPNGTSVQLPAVRYTVTAMDAAAGFIFSNGSAGGTGLSGQQYAAYSNTLVITTSASGTPMDALYGLSITKAVTSKPANGVHYVAGETVTFNITYANTGDMLLTDVMIYDALISGAEIAYAEMLHPGESRSLSVSCTVTEADVKRGFIANKATAGFTVTTFSGTAASNTVVVDTDGKPDDLSSVGTIDAALLRSDDFCRRTVTARDNASAAYEITFCTAHALPQSTVLMMRQTAVNDDMRLQVASYALALWRAEVEKMYQQIFAAADPVAKANVMAEYVCFLTDMANYEAMLKVMHPDQPGQVTQMIADMWEDKCVSLCGEIHAAAGQHQDSLLQVAASAGGAPADCGCTAEGEENGAKAYVRHYCAAHSFPFSMTDALLKGGDTAEGWTMLRQIWSVELTKIYNELYAGLGADGAPAMAEYQALMRWLPLREASLNALYPDHPEWVAQIMARTVMDRVNDLCALLR